jgi:Tol biopolymer transport system component
LNVNLDSVYNAGWIPCYTSKQDSTKKEMPCFTMPKAYKLTEGDFTVTGFEWSPDNKKIAFTRQPDPLINSGIHADIALVNLSDKKVTTLINNPAADFLEEWSPDGKFILYSSSLTDTISQFFRNNRLSFMIPNKKIKRNSNRD